MKSLPRRWFKVFSAFLAVAAFVAVATSPAAAAQGPWILPPKTLPGSPSAQVDYVEVAVGPGKTATAVWVERERNGNSDHSDDRWRLRATTRPAFGKFRRPVTLTSIPATNNGLRSTEVTAGAAGTLVSWIRDEKRQRFVEYRFRPTGGKFGPVRTFPDQPNPWSLITGRGSDGTLALAWDSESGVQVAIRLPRTGTWKTFDFGTDEGANLTDIAIGPDRDVIVTWDIRDMGGPTKPRAGLIRNASTLVPARTLAEKGRRPKVAFSPRGDAMFVWFQGNPSSIFGEKMGPQGGLGDPFQVSQPGRPGHGDIQPDVVIGGNGEISVVYLTNRRKYFGGDGYEAYRNLTVATRKPGSGFRYRLMGQGVDHNARNPRIVASADGTTTVLWDESSEIHSSTRPPGGDYPRQSTRIANGSAWTVDLASAPDGTAVAVWLVRSPNGVRLLTASTRP